LLQPAAAASTANAVKEPADGPVNCLAWIILNFKTDFDIGVRIRCLAGRTFLSYYIGVWCKL
jgi:hypothetical protein